VVKIKEQTLAEHPSRLALQQALATIYWDLGHHSDTVQMMKHIVGIRSQVLDKQHPDQTNSKLGLRISRMS
jgi:hypothetical protein